MKKKMAILVSLLGAVTLACSLLTFGSPGGKPLGGNDSSQPVSISKGLASLNSYHATLSIIFRGPDPQDSSTIVYETQRSQAQDARYTRMTSTQVKKGVVSPSNSAEEDYRIGNDQCINSSDTWSWTSMPPNEAEMMDLVMNVFDITPMVDNPKFVADETINGIPSKHYSFAVTGLGVKSGANVTANQGDYWLAVDGQYIVKYSLVVETVVDPNTSIIHMETLIDVTDINQPVNIAFPQACLDAKTAAPASSNQATQEPSVNPNPTQVTQEPSVNPNPTQAAQVNGFAGSWDTNYGDMTCAVDGENVNCTYTHNAGRIEAFLNPDGKSLEGSWFEAPTYKPADHAGRMVMTLSADGNSFTGQWWYGPAGEGGSWQGTRKAAPISY